MSIMIFVVFLFHCNSLLYVLRDFRTVTKASGEIEQVDKGYIVGKGLRFKYLF